MSYDRPKGLRDFNPLECSIHKRLVERLTNVFESFSYEQVFTPTFEHLELFEKKSGADISQHLYSFEDKGGRKICLRPEATASVARMFVNELRSWSKPLRLYYIQSMFRYEQPQKGRYREFWQAGVELLGDKSPQSDAELVLMASKALDAVGVPYVLRISQIGILRNALSARGFKQEDQDRIFHLLDSGKKQEALGEISDPSFKSILDVRGASGCTNELGDILGGDSQPLLVDFKKTLDLLDASKVRYVVDFSLARGLDYYTGLIFDAKVDCLGAQNQVLGGGRYDRLVEEFGGPSTPAVGFAFGVDRLIEARRESVVEDEVERSGVFVIPVSDELSDAAFDVAENIRRVCPGQSVRYVLGDKKLNRSLQKADEAGARWAVIVGKNEIAQESVSLKDLLRKSQETVKIDSLKEFLI